MLKSQIILIPLCLNNIVKAKIQIEIQNNRDQRHNYTEVPPNCHNCIIQEPE